MECQILKKFDNFFYTKEYAPTEVNYFLLVVVFVKYVNLRLAVIKYVKQDGGRGGSTVVFCHMCYHMWTFLQFFYFYFYFKLLLDTLCFAKRGGFQKP